MKVITEFTSASFVPVTPRNFKISFKNLFLLLCSEPTMFFWVFYSFVVSFYLCFSISICVQHLQIFVLFLKNGVLSGFVSWAWNKARNQHPCITTEQLLHTLNEFPWQPKIEQEPISKIGGNSHDELIIFALVFLNSTNGFHEQSRTKAFNEHVDNKRRKKHKAIESIPFSKSW